MSVGRHLVIFVDNMESVTIRSIRVKGGGMVFINRSIVVVARLAVPLDGFPIFPDKFVFVRMHVVFDVGQIL